MKAGEGSDAKRRADDDSPESDGDIGPLPTTSELAPKKKVKS